MEHKLVKRALLPNGNYFNGRGFYKKEEFIPDGWGQILYDGYKGDTGQVPVTLRPSPTFGRS